jgi:hypothetical protein
MLLIIGFQQKPILEINSASFLPLLLRYSDHRDSDSWDNRSAQPSQWLERLATIITLAALTSVCVIAVAGSFWDTLLNFIPDDAFYYFEIARRISQGQGSTFDGINPTNGYQPLWLLLLLPITPVMNLSREAGARVAMMLGVLMLGGALFILRAVAGRLAPSHRWAALLLPTSALSFAAFYGLESSLAALMFSLLLWQMTRSQTLPSVSSGAIIGLTAGGLVLSRLDSALYVIALDLIWVVRIWRTDAQKGWRVSLHGWLVCLLAQALIVTPYLAFNIFFFRHLFPISAVMKAERSTALNLSWARSLLAWLSVAGIATGVMASWLRPRNQMKMVWQTSLIGSVLMLGLNVVAGGRESYSWYFTLPVMCSGLFGCVLLGRLSAPGFRSKSFAGLAILICVMILTGSISRRFSKPLFADRMDRARWIAANAPAQAVFAEANCGILGYTSGHSFIDLDGLTNSFSYERAIRDDQLAEWLTKAGLNAVALPATSVLETLTDGSRRMRLVIRGATERTIYLILRRWDDDKPSGEYVLWRVVRIER